LTTPTDSIVSSKEPILDVRQKRIVLLTDNLLLLLRNKSDEAPSVWLEVHDISGAKEGSTEFQSQAHAETGSLGQNPDKRSTLRLKLLLPFTAAAYHADILDDNGDESRGYEELPDDPNMANGNSENVDEGKKDAGAFYMGDRSAERISLLWFESSTTKKYYVAVSHHHIIRLIAPTTLASPSKQSFAAQRSGSSIAVFKTENPDTGGKKATNRKSNRVVGKDNEEKTRANSEKRDRVNSKEKKSGKKGKSARNSTGPVTVQWADWGPMATRWFRDPDYGCSTSSCRTLVYFPNEGRRFIEVNNLYPSSWSPSAYSVPSSRPVICLYSVVICDFNQRLIKRNLSANRPQPMSVVPPVIVHRCNDQADDSPNSPPQSPPSNIIAEEIITEEWVLGSPDFTEKVRSRLPFRFIIRKKEWNQILTSNMRGNPFAFMMVSRTSSRHK
jgi:hypothetical protein